MARDLAMFLRPLDPSPEPGLEGDDPRLAEMVSLVEQGEHGAAADIAEGLSAEGIHDIRALSFLFYEAYRERGIAELGELFDVIALALGPSFEAIGPARRRKEHFNKRLIWLFDTIAGDLEYHQKHGTPEWDTLQEGLGPGALDAIVQSGERVAAALSTDEYASASRGLGRLLSFLRARADALADSPSSAAEQPSPAPPEGEAPASPAAHAPPRDEAPAQAAAGSTRPRVELVVAQPFLDLLAKLRAFEVLVEKGDFSKAAVVAEDLQHIIESFDPRAYFPETFARFSALLSNHIDPLSEHLDDRESLAWKARSQFYRVDLDGFVRS